MSKTGKVYLVGAGCGDYDYITLKGMKILQKCDTIVYDSLIDSKLLAFAPENSEKICVGKRAGHHSETQENINKILIEKASEGKTVARLKGGDPFVFGRGGEEILALQEKRIEYSVIPGISSSYAVAELAGIPVTHRRLSRSFHVITGHTADDLLPENFEKYAKLDGTLVFLMGLRNLRRIADGLISGGMSSDTPAAVISCGGTAKQRVVRDVLENIADTAEKENIIAPAVIVVGETARLDLSPTIIRPLDKISVTVTGTKRFADKLAPQLNELGADVRFLDYFRVSEYSENKAFDAALQNISDYSWLVLTSVNGAEIFLKRMKKQKVDLRRLAGLKIAVIGSCTAEALEKSGIFPDLVPKKFTSEELGNALAKTVNSNEKVLILRAEKGSAILTKILDEHSISYNDIKTYDVIRTDETAVNTQVDTDFLTFASSSGVDSFFESGYTFSEKTKVVCIGEITAETLKKHGVTDFSTADIQTSAGMADKILQEADR